MFKKKQKQPFPEIVINGTSLPKNYWSADIYDNVAIAKDGKHYAHVDEEGVLATGKTPTPGILNTIDGKLFTYDLPQKERQVIKADVFMEQGKLYIGKRPVEEGIYEREPSR